EVTLQAGLAGAAGRARPTARLALAPAELGVRQESEWVIDADRTTLTSRLTVTVRRGSLGQLGVRVPPGWEVEHVEAADPAAGAGVAPGEGGGPAPAGAGTLRIDLARPLTPGAEALALTVRAAGPRPGAAALPFPDLAPEGAPGRSATLAVRVNGPFAAG